MTASDIGELVNLFDNYDSVVVTQKRNGQYSLKITHTTDNGVTYVATLGLLSGKMTTKNVWKTAENKKGRFSGENEINSLSSKTSETAASSSLSHKIAHSEYIVNTGEKITTKQESEISEYAIQEALKATYRDFNGLASALNRIKNANKATKIIGEGVAPFTTTPLNILKRGIEYSPVGVAKGMYEVLHDVKNGVKTPAEAIDHKKFLENKGK